MADQLRLFGEQEAKQAEAKKQRQTEKYQDSMLPVLAERKEVINRLFNLWRTLFDYTRAKLTKPRTVVLNARLHHGFSEDDLAQVLHFVKDIPFWRGQNDRNKPYDDLTTLFANNERTERLLVQARAGRKEIDRRTPHLRASDKPYEYEEF